MLAREEKGRLEASGAAVLPVPGTLSELSGLLEQGSPAQYLEVVEQIYTCNHPALSPANKQQLLVGPCGMSDSSGGDSAPLSGVSGCPAGLHREAGD